MSSSGKTPHLGLNKWAGADKPKKDDFNQDNQLVDDAFGELSQTAKEAAATVSTHVSNGALHVTAADKQAWNAKDQFIMGTYKGSETSSRTLEVGFRPRFGMVYALGQPAVNCIWDAEKVHVYSCFFGESGCSDGVALTSSGFTVSHHTASRPDGYALKLNDSDYSYVYLVWK